MMHPKSLSSPHNLSFITLRGKRWNAQRLSKKNRKTTCFFPRAIVNSMTMKRKLDQGWACYSMWFSDDGVLDVVENCNRSVT